MSILDYALTSLRRAAEHGGSWPVSPGEAAALVAEVDRLRAQRVLDNEEAARLYDFARDKGAALERDATVAWLRSEPEKGVACDGHRHANGGSCVVFTDMTAPDLADAIERGDHRRIDQEKA